MNVMVSLSNTPMAHPPRSNPFLRSSCDAPAVLCITPSTVTCVMVVSFMVAAPFSLGFCRRLIRLDRGADLIDRSRVRPANSTRRIWNTMRTRTATCASARECHPTHRSVDEQTLLVPNRFCFGEASVGPARVGRFICDACAVAHCRLVDGIGSPVGLSVECAIGVPVGVVLARPDGEDHARAIACPDNRVPCPRRAVHEIPAPQRPLFPLDDQECLA